MSDNRTLLKSGAAFSCFHLIHTVLSKSTVDYITSRHLQRLLAKVFQYLWYRHALYSVQQVLLRGNTDCAGEMLQDSLLGECLQGSRGGFQTQDFVPPVHVLFLVGEGYVEAFV